MWIATVAAALAVVLVVVGLIIGEPRAGVEGAYFNRSIGVPAYSGFVARTGPGVFDPADGNLWLGAGVALAVASAVALAFIRRDSSNALPE